MAKDTGRSQVQTAIVRILNGLSSVSNANYRQACFALTEHALKIPEATVEEQDSFKKILSEISSMSDLAHYIALVALQSCHRTELKDMVLKSNNFISLSQYAPESYSVI